MTDPDFDLPGLVEALVAKRDADGLTWRQVAAQARVSASTLTRLQQGAWPDLRTFSRIVRWLGVSPEDFLPGEGSESGFAVAARAIREDGDLTTAESLAIVAILRAAYGLASRP